MPLKVAARGGIAPFHVMEVMKAAAERAATGADVLHLEVGQPSTGAPAGALAAVRAALAGDRLGYTDALGIPALRRRIARSYRELYDVEVPVDRIAVTTGASGACILAFLAAFDPGDRVAITEPGYPCYRNMLTAFGIEPVAIPIGPATRFQPTTAALEAAGPLAGLVIASPANPTGATLTGAELAALADWCRRAGVRLVADEIYHRITYGGPAPTALAAWDEAIVINSFSKYYSMTGWRLGWLVAPPELMAPIERLAQNLTISPPSPSQAAALAAFDCEPELDAHVRRYATNRDVLLEGLAAAGIARLAPADGAFYAYADVGALADDSQSLCARWLAEIGVATTPGIDFDLADGRRWVRFSFAGSTAEITAAAERLVRWSRAAG